MVLISFIVVTQLGLNALDCFIVLTQLGLNDTFYEIIVLIFVSPGDQADPSSGEKMPLFFDRLHEVTSNHPPSSPIHHHAFFIS